MNIPTILIADDEPLTREHVRNYIERRIDCKFLEAKDGEEAITCLKDNSCDIIILDIRMPKKSGIHVLDELKKMGKSAFTIVITGWDSDIVAEECVKRDVEILPKPFSFDELYEKITRQLKKRNLLVLKKDS